ncbi:MAG: putative ABC transporter permease [Clostridia bacterium]|nr:putative ABC transporter permease [Clostridia bacterium]
MIKRFFIYGILGWGMEIFWTGMSSLIGGDLRLIGYSNLWMFFIYGLAVLLEPIHDIIRSWSWLFRGVIWVVMIWGIEYASGLILFKILGVYPWYYAGPFAVDGIVNLSFAPAWFVAGLLFEWVHRTLDTYEIA